MRVRLAAAAVALLALAGTAYGERALNAGHSGWRWGNPHPQARALFALGFAGRTGYAVGNFGTLLRTDDRGRSWSMIDSGTRQYLDQLQVFSRSSFVAGGGCTLIRTDDRGRHIRTLPFRRCYEPNPDSWLTAIAFPTPRVGYLFRGEGQPVLRTNDGGKTWSPGGAPTSIDFPDDASFATPEIGLVVGSAPDVEGPVPGSAMRTTDGGRTWTEVLHSANALSTVRFADRNTAYAGGYRGVYGSGDGGLTWRRRPARIGDVRHIACRDALRCVAATGTGVVTTDDGFVTTRRGRGDHADAESVAYSSEQSVGAVGYGGGIFVSSDAGATWDLIRRGIHAWWERMGFDPTDPRRAWVTGFAQEVYTTADGGESWRLVRSSDLPGNRSPSLDAAWLPGRHGYGALDRKFFVTEDGGRNWARRARKLPDLAFGVWASPEGRVVLVTGALYLVRSTDGGRTFSRVRSAAIPRRTVYMPLRQSPGGPIALFGFAGIAVSDDHGAHWRRIRPPRPHRTVTWVDFVDARTAYAITGDGRLWRTRSGGRHWSDVHSIGSRPRPTTLSFADARHGWFGPVSFAGEKMAWLFRTDDGGRTWRPQAVDSSKVVDGDLVATSRTGGFVLTGVSSAFFTRTSGYRGRPSALTLAADRRSVTPGATVTVSGRLSPAHGGAPVYISIRRRNGVHWRRVAVETDRQGDFRAKVEIAEESWLVAQWPGDRKLDGAGSEAVLVDVERAPG